ncbi:MAG: multidrug ABC transporter permease [Clostridiales bacterium]|nr:multidrug ABC transporter permease [Clostridiales bacterium]
MRRLFRTYGVLIKNELNSRMAYRFDFFTGLFVSLLGEMLLPVITLVIYSTGAAFPGWSYHEVLLIQSVFIMSTAVANTLFFGVVVLVMEHIREGTFDLYLIKPAPVTLLVIGRAFSFEHVFVFSGGLALFICAVLALPAPGILAWVQFVLVFLLAIAVLMGFVFLMAATLFKWVGNSRLFEVFEAITQFGRYPASIYSKSFRALITYAVPVALLGTIPAAALLKPDSTNGLLLAVVFAFVFLGIGFSVWKLMLKSYSSTGG